MKFFMAIVMVASAVAVGAAATSVSGRALDCGHLLPEEQPSAVLAEFQQFFRG